MSAWLFVPGNRPERFGKALASGADTVVIDLEDAVSPADKGAAREALAQWLADTTARVALRVNGADSEWFADDLALLQQDVQRARRLGFGGKLCIHPRQVAAVRAGFAPSDAEPAWAERVLLAAAQSAGAAIALDGKMIDKPVMLRAQAILREAGR